MDQSMFDGFSYTSETFKYPYNEEGDDIIIDHHHFCTNQQQEESNDDVNSQDSNRELDDSKVGNEGLLNRDQHIGEANLSQDHYHNDDKSHHNNHHHHHHHNSKGRKT